MSEVTGSWVEVDSSDEETSDGGDDDADIDDPDWVDCEDDESNGELMESLEAVALSDQYHVDDATDLTYSLSGMSVEHDQICHLANELGVFFSIFLAE